MRVLFFGSGAFAVPTLDHLHANGQVDMVVSQPDRGSGRGRRTTPTPVAARALELGLDVLRPEQVNDSDVIEQLRSRDVQAWVVIAFGQKLSQALLADRFAINLHGSLLPRWRGAAPIHHAIMAQDQRTGVSVITLASVMDAGDVLHQSAMPIDPTSTTADVHDALALLGPEAIEKVLRAHATGSIEPMVQVDQDVTLAPKLSRADAVLDLTRSADALRCHINGLSPWPGCQLAIDGHTVRLLRAGPAQGEVDVGQVLPDGRMGCTDGCIALLQVQPQGGKPMTFAQWANGRRISTAVGVEVVS